MNFNKASILDWGCGPGRIVRHLPSIVSKAKIFGSDYNEESINWCRENIEDVGFEVNGLARTTTSWRPWKYKSLFQDTSFANAGSIRKYGWTKISIVTPIRLWWIWTIVGRAEGTPLIREIKYTHQAVLGVFRSEDRFCECHPICLPYEVCRVGRCTYYNSMITLWNSGAVWFDPHTSLLWGGYSSGKVGSKLKKCKGFYWWSRVGCPRPNACRTWLRCNTELSSVSGRELTGFWNRTPNFCRNPELVGVGYVECVGLIGDF